MFEDALKNIAVLTKESQDAILASIVDQQERYEKAVQIYAMHYATSEGVDRSYPHSRGEYNCFQVRPKMRHTKSLEHISKLREFITCREEMLKLLNLEDYDLKSARSSASEIANRAIDECQCAECYRGP